MARLLFVTNGHGEVAIADRIAADVRMLCPELELDHLALVGAMRMRNARDVGPRHPMPSGGLIAMGDVRNIVRDVRAGLTRLTIEQWRFLRGTRRAYALVVAVGDAFALWMALRTSAPCLYVGTAKSVHVAPYGAAERALLRRARAIFVRDEATAAALRSAGVLAEAPGNVIADLYDEPGAEMPGTPFEDFASTVALLPGSRERAYADAPLLVEIFDAVARGRPGLGAVLSIAPGIDAERMKDALRAVHDVRAGSLPLVPFEIVRDGRIIVRAWSGGIGTLLRGASLVLGQAGTANEAAAAAGVPVLAIASEYGGERGWYRRRQAQLLGEALVTISGDPLQAASQVAELLDDPARRARLGAIGRARMGAPGGARRIAGRIAGLLASIGKSTA